MKIKVITRFLDGTDSFEIDDQRTVSDERGAYFVKNGWAVDMAGNVASGQADSAVDLNIHNSVIGQEAQNG